jgi:hypothetical protein
MPSIFVPPRSMSMRNMVQIFRNSGELFKRATAIKLRLEIVARTFLSASSRDFPVPC